MAALKEAVQKPGQLIWNPEALGCIVPPIDESTGVSPSVDRKEGLQKVQHWLLFEIGVSESTDGISNTEA